MPTYLTPGVYIEEVSGGPRPIEAVGTSIAGFVGVAPDETKHVNEARWFDNWTQFTKEFVAQGSVSTPLAHAVFGFFQNGGGRCCVVNVGADNAIVGDGQGSRKGLEVLEESDEIAIVAAPGYSDAASYDALLSHCEKMKDRVAILDAPAQVSHIDALTITATASRESKKARGVNEEPKSPSATKSEVNAALPRQSDEGWGAFYFPHITVRDPLSPKDLADVAPSGHIAGIYARSDATRGVHKAPANEAVRGALNVTYRVTREEQATLNPHGVNCIRLFPGEGIRVYGARTLADSASEWRYLNVHRLFNMVEESIARSTRWVVFEPNDRPLWKAIRRDVSAFLTMLWRQGALMGRTPEEAFFVQCDEETNPPDVVDPGIVVTVVASPREPRDRYFPHRPGDGEPKSQPNPRGLPWPNPQSLRKIRKPLPPPARSLDIGRSLPFLQLQIGDPRRHRRPFYGMHGVGCPCTHHPLPRRRHQPSDPSAPRSSRIQRGHPPLWSHLFQTPLGLDDECRQRQGGTPQCLYRHDV